MYCNYGLPFSFGLGLGKYLVIVQTYCLKISKNGWNRTYCFDQTTKQQAYTVTVSLGRKIHLYGRYIFYWKFFFCKDIGNSDAFLLNVIRYALLSEPTDPVSQPWS